MGDRAAKKDEATGRSVPSTAAEAIAHLPVATVAVAPDGRLEAWNPAFCAVCGLTAAHAPPDVDLRGFAIAVLGIVEPTSLLRTVDNLVSDRDASFAITHPVAGPCELRLCRRPDGGLYLCLLPQVAPPRDHTSASSIPDGRLGGHLQAVLDTIVDGIITIDARGIIQSANPAAQRLFGYSADEMLGRNVNMLMPSSVARRHDGYVGSFLTTGEAKIIGIGREVEGRRADGSTFPAELAVKEFDANGQRMFVGSLRDISDRKAAEQELRDFGERLQATLNTIVDGIITIDARGIIQSANPAAQRLFGYSAQDLRGRNVSMLMPPKVANGHDGYINAFLTTGQAKIIGIGREVEGRRADGSTFPAELAVKEFDANGQRMFVGSLRDISERKAAEQELRDSSERLQATLNTIVDGIITIDARGTIQSANPAAQRLFGYSAQDLRGRNVSMLMPSKVATQHDGFINAYLNTGQAKIIGVGREVEGRRADGSTFPAELAVKEFDSNGQRMFVGSLRDISDRKAAESQLRQMAATDSLTGLHNRRSFEDRAKVELERWRRYEQPLSLIIIDADHFKAVNDTYGHQVGDEVLLAIAGLCRTSIRRIDMPARIGGEEFAVLLPSTNLDSAAAMAERIRSRAESAKSMSRSQRVKVTLSLGVATCSEAAHDIDSLLRLADEALYAAKADGRNRVVVAT